MATTSLQALYDRAQRFLEENDAERAIAVAQHILEHFPKNIESHRLLGEAYLVSRAFEQAEEAFRRVLTIDPENIPAHVAIGITYERQGKLDQAVSEFEQALEIQPDMTELRNQLLRLYADAWGSEHAQLRLSRPGLARLYARGQMLPQAIQEFRSVVEDHPERLDARVGLIESLWRNGQEDVAIRTCQEVLARHDDVLKANLLMGYIRLAAGDPSGKTYWRTAQQLDPYQNVATGLFGKLPNDAPGPETTLPDWDENAWQQRQQQQEQTTVSSPPEKTITPATIPAARATSDEALLASLLGLQEFDTFEPAVKPDTSTTPFSFEETNGVGSIDQQDDLGRESSRMTTSPAPPSPPLHAEGDQAEQESQQPASSFDVDDLGLEPLSFDEPAEEPAAPEPFSFDEPAEEPAAPEPFSFDEPAEEPAAPEPFSFDEPAEEPAAPEEPDTSMVDDLGGLQPFDWSSEMGLEASEESGLETLEEEDQPLPESPPLPGDISGMPDIPDIDPFDLSASDVGTPSAPAETPEEPSLQSLSELEPFDWDTSDIEELPKEEKTGTPDSDEESFKALQPFSLADLELSADTEGSFDLDAVSLPPSLQPFSLEDQGIETPPPIPTPPSAPPREPSHLASEEEPSAEPGAYSWQLPSSRPDTDLLSKSQAAREVSEIESDSIFAKLKQRRSELPEEEEQPDAPTSLDDDEALQFFSDDDVSLRDDDEREATAVDPSSTLAPVAEEQQFESPVVEEDIKEEPDLPSLGGAETIEEPEVTPLSLQELGLSDEEIAALGQQEEPPLLSDLPPEEQEEPDLPSLGGAETVEEPEVTPLSLQELGLSDEEIAALGQQEEPPLLSDLPPEEEQEEPDLPSLGGAETIEEPEVTPLSLQELGLSDEEIAALGQQEEPPLLSDLPPEEEQEEPDLPSLGGAETIEEPEVTPLSLQELGLSDEEIAALGQQEETPAEETKKPASSPTAHFGESDLTPFSLDDLGEIEEQETQQKTEETQKEEIPPPPPTVSKAPETQLLDDIDILPFSLDDLNLDDSSTFAGGMDEQERERLGLTDDELLGLDTFGGAKSAISTEAAKTKKIEDEPPPDTGDPDLDHLIMLGRRQGFVDLTDIISIVDDPVAESEHIEDIGRALYRAGIEIRDGDEVIDMEEEDVDYEEGSYVEDESHLEPAEPAATLAAPAEQEEPEVTPLSLAELGLTEDEITSLGLAQGESDEQDEGIESEDIPTISGMPEEEIPPPPPAAEEDAAFDFDISSAPEPAAAGSAEPEVAPLSLKELGLSDEEIAALDLEPTGSAPDTTTPPAAEPPPPAAEEDAAFDFDISSAPEPAAAGSAEPEVAPLSLKELGLSDEEIAALDLEPTGSAPDTTTPPPAEPPPPAAEEDAAFDFDISSAPEPAAAGSAEPEVAPLSLKELGLSDEEIAALGLGDDAPTSAAAAEQAPAAPPISEFGLTEEELALLGGLAATSASRSEEDSEARVDLPPLQQPEAEELEAADFLSFDLTEEQKAAAIPAKRTRPRDKSDEEEQKLSPEEAAEDAAFVPTALDELDDIWDLPDTEPDQAPARITIERPQQPHRDQREQPTTDSEGGAPTRGRRGSLPARSSQPVRQSRPSWPQGKESGKAPGKQPSFIPTGDEDLDEHLRQLEAEPENYGLCLAIAHIGMESERYDLAIYHYNYLIKERMMLDDIIETVSGAIGGIDDEAIRQKLYRVIGDAYTKQKRFKEAMAAYSGKISL